MSNENDVIAYNAPPNATYGSDRMALMDPIPLRRSVYRRRSFVNEFAMTKGPPQILVVIILFAFGFGSIIGVVPAIMSDRYARLNHGYSEEKPCSDYEPIRMPQACLDGSSEAQNAVAVEQFVSHVLTFFTSSLIGSLSDQYGRKGVLLIGLLLWSLSPLSLVVVQMYDNMNPALYYTAGALQGFVNWIAVALSALSDVMPKQWRAPSFGLVLAGFSMGLSCAPLLALYLGHFNVSCLSFSVVLVGFVAVLVFVPETLSKEAAQQAKLARSAELGNLEGMKKYFWVLYRPFWELSILNRSTLFRLLSALAFFSGIGSSGDQSLLLYYIEGRIGFTDKDVAVFILTIGLVGIFVQGVLLKIANDYLGEKMVLIFSFLIGTVHDVVFSLAKTKEVIFANAFLSSFLMMAFPTISAIKSNNVNASEQGRIQGALYSVQALSSALGPALFRTVATASQDSSLFGPGSMFLVSASVYIIASCFACMLPPEANSKQDESDIPLIDDASEPLSERPA